MSLKKKMCSWIVFHYINFLQNKKTYIYIYEKLTIFYILTQTFEINCDF
jgi:hypothetical protein